MPSSQIMKPEHDVGIISYGSYVPRYRILAEEIGRIWGKGEDGYPCQEKSVPGPDEDTATIALEAARNALARSENLDPSWIRAVWIGSESHPYAVKPTGTIVAEAIGAVPSTLSADLEFACKAGTEAMQAAVALVGSGMVRYALAAGVDTAQGRPGDALEYTAGAGGAAYIIGPAEESVAVVEGSFSYVTDTPDFWRRPYQHFPRHASRFTGTPAYFKHTLGAAQAIMDGIGYGAGDFRYVVFHQPNTRFPIQAARQLGFRPEQYEPGLLVPMIGNTYAGSSLLGFSAILDIADAGDRVLTISYGSGAGSDAFVWRITDLLYRRQGLAPKTQDYIARREVIDYGLYVRYREKLYRG